MTNGVKPDLLSPAQLQALGLDTQPFDRAPPGGRPFRDGSIDTQVNVALHILQHTDQVLLVQGAAGLGKSAFLELLDHAAGDELILIQLQPTTGDPVASIHRTIAEAGSMDGADETAAVSALRRLWDTGQRPVLLLDDADTLPREALEALLSLHTTLRQHQATPGLVLTGQRDLMPFVGAAAREDGLEPHVVNLHPFEASQTAAYIRDRLRQAGSLDTGQLTDSQCRQIHHRTRGNPANINREATRLLAAAVPTPDGGGAAPPKGRWTIPVVVFAMMVLVGGLLTASFLVEEGEPPSAGAEPELASPERETLQLPDRGRLEERLRESQADNGGAQPQANEDNTPAAKAPTGRGSGRADAADESPGPMAAETQNQEPKATALAPQQTPQAAPVPPAEENEPAEPPAGQPAADAGKTDTDVEPQTAADDSEPRPKKPQPPPADHYAIQLIGAYDRDSLERFVDELDLPGETRIVTTRRDGRDWHVVLYGNFAGRAAAKASLRGLPEPARAHGPWIRTFGSL